MIWGFNDSAIANPKPIDPPINPENLKNRQNSDKNSIISLLLADR